MEGVMLLVLGLGRFMAGGLVGRRFAYAAVFGWSGPTGGFAGVGLVLGHRRRWGGSASEE